MADPTPPSDVPDPASPTPSNPQPGFGPAPKRIRSMPDGAVARKTAGAIRSMPEPSRSAARPAGTYAANFGADRSWKRALTVLWSLLAVIFAAEAANAACYLLSGKIGWPPASHLVFGSTDVGVFPLEVIRLVLVCTIFIGLWVGAGWLRYLLTIVAFLAGAWLLVQMIQSYHAAPKFYATGQMDAPVYGTLESVPKVALGIVYVMLAGYVAFSVDVSEFLVHRRTQGRIWSALLVTVFVYGVMLLILCAQPFYNLWLQAQRPSVLAYGDETLHAIAEGWKADGFNGRLSPDFAASFKPENRQASLDNFKDLGKLVNANPAPPLYLTAVKSLPLQNIVPAPASIAARVTHDGSGFIVVARYNTAPAVFEHGEVQFGLDLVRDLFGSWRVAGFDAVPIRIDHPAPPPAPGSSSATPIASSAGDLLPGATPTMAPAPSAIPTATTSTLPTDAAAPTPPASPVTTLVATPLPTMPALPTPFASALPPTTPAATPVPSTGG